MRFESMSLNYSPFKKTNLFVKDLLQTIKILYNNSDVQNVESNNVKPETDHLLTI